MAVESAGGTAANASRRKVDRVSRRRPMQNPSPPLLSMSFACLGRLKLCWVSRYAFRHRHCVLLSVRCAEIKDGGLKMYSLASVGRAPVRRARRCRAIDRLVLNVRRSGRALHARLNRCSALWGPSDARGLVLLCLGPSFQCENNSSASCAYNVQSDTRP